MLEFVQNWFRPQGNPIGVDFGSDCLRLAQVQWTDGQFSLIAAASADVPSHIRHEPAGRAGFFVEGVRDLLAQGDFRGRKAILALPAHTMFIQHLRIAKMDEEATRRALPWEAQGKLPIDPGQAVLRHVIAGEVYSDQDPKNEVVVMAAGREVVNQLLALASRARLEVVGMNVEPKALLDCFGHGAGQRDAEKTSCYVDIGCSGSRAIIARDGQIMFARSIPIGGDHFNRAVSAAMKISFEEAKLLRIRLCNSAEGTEARRHEGTEDQPAERRSDEATEASGDATEEHSFALLGAAVRSQPAEGGTGASPVVSEEQGRHARATGEAEQVEQAISEQVAKLTEELNLCRRYHEATFPNRPVDRLIFVGGESRHRGLCQTIARQMGLAAQVGDPLARLADVGEVGIESGIDRRQPQPGWAVAIGLSMGPSVLVEK